MSSDLSRRTALIAAGQGMAVLLLAACGKAGDASGPSPATTPRPGPTSGPTSPTPAQAQVTVPGLESSALPSAGRTLIPLQPVTRSSASPAPTAATAAPSTDVAATPQPPTPHPAATPHPTPTPDSSATADPTTTNLPPRSTTSGPAPTAASRARPATTSTAAGTTSGRRGSAAGSTGKVVAIDPGHNGANGQHPEIINQLINGGYGQRNVCNTTGTQTDAGYPEHEFAWRVASYLGPLLQAKGITVVLTRSTDTGVGPCTDKRAAIENRADADAVVSIHGDGAPAQVRGFYVLTATRPPAGPVIAAASLRLAACIAGAAIDEGFPPSNTLGSGGLWKRDDLTGLNLSTRPKILIECGNMRNAAEAALMSSAAGQRRYATALANGVLAFLRG